MRDSGTTYYDEGGRSVRVLGVNPFPEEESSFIEEQVELFPQNYEGCRSTVHLDFGAIT